MICYMLYAPGGGGGKGLETGNEFACGRNGGSASNSLYIFRFSINPTDLPFFVVVQSICLFSYFSYYFQFCMYVCIAHQLQMLVRTWKTVSKYQLSGPSCLERYRRADQEDVNRYVCTCIVHVRVCTYILIQ